MTDSYFVLCDGVLGLRTTGENLKWSFGVNAPPVDKAEYDACTVRLRVKVGDVPGFADDGELIGESKLGKYHYFSGSPGEDSLYYHRKFMFRSDLRLLVTGLLGDEPTLTVNKTYFRYINHRFMNLHSVGYILTDIACLLLLRKGFSPLHCSAFRHEDKTVIVFAPPNTGKTLSTMMACMEYGSEFIAEDLAITDGSIVYSVPWTSTFRYYSQVEQSSYSKFLNSATKVFPPLELLPLSEAKPIHAYVPANRMTAESKITHLVMLERGTTEVRTESRAESSRKIVNLNRFEFKYPRSPLIGAYEFFNPALDIEGAWKAEQETLLRMVEMAERCIIVKTDDATRYAGLVLEALHDGPSPLS